MIYLPLFSFLLVYFYMKWDKSIGDIVVLQPPTLSVNTYMEMTTGNLEILPLRFAKEDIILGSLKYNQRTILFAELDQNQRKSNCSLC